MVIIIIIIIINFDESRGLLDRVKYSEDFMSCHSS